MDRLDDRLFGLSSRTALPSHLERMATVDRLFLKVLRALTGTAILAAARLRPQAICCIAGDVGHQQVGPGLSGRPSPWPVF